MKMYSALLRANCWAAGALFILSVLSTALAQQESPNVVPQTQRETHVRKGDHSIQINSDGVSPESKDFEDQLKHLFKSVEKYQPARLVVFVHGGLVTLKDANDRADKLAREIADEHDGTYPIFVNWEAGLVTSYVRHLAFERNGISYKGSPGAGGAVLSSPLVLAADLGRGATRLPINTTLSFAKAAQNGDWMYKANPRSFPIKNKFNETLRLFSDNPKETQRCREYFRSGLRYNPRDGSTPRVSLSLGADTPKNIRLGHFAQNILTVPGAGGYRADPRYFRNARVAQHASSNLLNVPALRKFHNAQYSSGSCRRRSGSKKSRTRCRRNLLSQAHEFMIDHPNLALDLIGHSMGTIVIDDAYRECPNLPARNIIYMAAACSIRDFQVSTGRYIEKHAGVNFYNLSHPRAELEEVHAWGTPVRGSLLVWIDEFFQSPESFGYCTLARSKMP